MKQKSVIFRYLAFIPAFLTGTVFALPDSASVPTPAAIPASVPPETDSSAQISPVGILSGSEADSSLPDSVPAESSGTENDSAAQSENAVKNSASSEKKAAPGDSTLAKKTTKVEASVDTVLPNPPKKTPPKANPFRIGFMYEMARLHKADLNTEMTRDGKRYDVDVDVSDMVGVLGRYGVNQWISLFGILGYQKFDIGYVPKEKISSDKRKKFSVRNILVQANAEVGFSFLDLKNYQFRLLGFFGGTTGISLIGDDYYTNTPLFGYTRGVALEINIHRVELLAGFRSSHIYFHTYRSNHRNEEDYSFMLDFDTMSSPFFSVGIGF